MKKPGHRSGTKERIGEKHKEKDVILKNMNIVYGIKGKTAEKKHMAGEKYGVERRKNRRGGYEK